MNVPPPQSTNALDAEERAVAKALPRLHGRAVPGPDVDASILAAAQSAVQGSKPVHARNGPRIWWIGQAALAASLVLAVGMAWRLRPLPSLPAIQPAAADNAAKVQAAPSGGPAMSEQPMPMVVMQPTDAQASESARQQANQSFINAEDALPSPDDRPQASDAPAAPPPAPPALSADPASPDLAAMEASSSPPTDPQAGSPPSQLGKDAMRMRANVPAGASSANGMTQAATSEKAGVDDSTRQAATTGVPPALAMPAMRSEAAKTVETGAVDAPEADIPPATAASPDVRDAWLRRISQLLEQGNRQDAKASLAEFKRRYPNAVLPPALKALDIER
jgi:hypothetical protein